MHIAALVTWLITALGGFYLLGTWIARGALRAPGSSRLPAPVLFGHFLLAAAGLVVWIIYLAADKKALAWTAFALLVPVALLLIHCSRVTPMGVSGTGSVTRRCLVLDRTSE